MYTYPTMFILCNGTRLNYTSALIYTAIDRHEDYLHFEESPFYIVTISQFRETISKISGSFRKQQYKYVIACTVYIFVTAKPDCE